MQTVPAERARRRPPPVPWEPVRWPVEIAATIHEVGSCALPVTVTDLSIDGCRLWAGFRLTPGRAARLRIDGFAPFAATILWCEDWCAGLRFDATMHAAVLYHLAARYRSLRTTPSAP